MYACVLSATPCTHTYVHMYAPVPICAFTRFTRMCIFGTIPTARTERTAVLRFTHAIGVLAYAQMIVFPNPEANTGGNVLSRRLGSVVAIVFTEASRLQGVAQIWSVMQRLRTRALMYVVALCVRYSPRNSLPVHTFLWDG
jgi:hypothetical protein